MRNDRDGLLDGWADLNRRLSTHEAALHIAIDLLMECIDVTDSHQHPRLHAEIRSFLLNTTVGAR